MWKGFQKPKRLATELESLTDKFGKFSAQPFERGWGTTVGNSLRRALLSSIEGAAITAVKIEGVLHEFSSIPGRGGRRHRHHSEPETGAAEAEQRSGQDDFRQRRKSRRRDLRDDRGRRRLRRARQDRLYRHGQRRRQAATGNARQERPRLRVRRPQFRRRSADRLHSRGLGPLARAQGATTRWKPRASAR